MSAAQQPYTTMEDGTAMGMPHDGLTAGAGAAETGPVHHGMGAKEAKHMAKVLDKEGKNEDKQIKKQVKEISSAEKAERKAEKADEKAIKRHSKAVEAEHKANKELERAQAKHDEALREAQRTDREIGVKKEHHSKVSAGLQNAKAHMDELTSAREQHAAYRHEQSSKLNAIIDSEKN